MPLGSLGSIAGVMVTKMSLLPTQILYPLLPRIRGSIKSNAKPSNSHWLSQLRGGALQSNATYTVISSKSLPIECIDDQRLGTGSAKGGDFEENIGRLSVVSLSPFYFLCLL